MEGRRMIVEIFWQWLSKNADQILLIIGRLLCQALILYYYFSLKMRTSRKEKKEL